MDTKTNTILYAYSGLKRNLDIVKLYLVQKLCSTVCIVKMGTEHISTFNYIIS
jgi:hypothetical protein